MAYVTRLVNIDEFGLLGYSELHCSSPYLYELNLLYQRPILTMIDELRFNAKFERSHELRAKFEVPFSAIDAEADEPRLSCLCKMTDTPKGTETVV